MVAGRGAEDGGGTASGRGRRQTESGAGRTALSGLGRPGALEG